MQRPFQLYVHLGEAWTAVANIEAGDEFIQTHRDKLVNTGVSKETREKMKHPEINARIIEVTFRIDDKLLFDVQGRDGDIIARVGWNVEKKALSSFNMKAKE